MSNGFPIRQLHHDHNNASDASARSKKPNEPRKSHFINKLSFRDAAPAGPG
jgi:hypothetical protein